MSHTHHDILTLDSNWEPHAWINLEKAIQHEATDEVIEHLGESIFVYHGGKNRFTGEQSVLETSSIIVVSGAPSARRYKDPALTNIALFQRDLHICAYCGNHYAPNELTRDHIWPQNPTHGPGGKDIWMNVVTACRDCNSLKGNIMPGQHLPKDNYGRQILGPQGTGLMSPLYVPYVPCKAEHMIMKGRNVKADQMEFLLARVKNKSSRIFDYAKSVLH